MNIALIVASGNGKRMGDTIVPKQYLEVRGKPLMFYCLETFQNCENIDAIIICTNENFKEKVSYLCEKYKITKVKAIVNGGNSRQESVYNGLINIKSFAKDDDIVLIHDAVRPLVSEDIILRNIEVATKLDAATTAIKVNDTTFISEDQKSFSEVLNRDLLFQNQTPQSFKLSLILKAHQEAKDLSSTDDAQLINNLGKKVYLVNGSKLNIKITTQEDLTLLNSILVNE